MKNKEYELLEEAINLELIISDLYIFYNENFIEDKEFWGIMSNEEKNHASLLKSAKLISKLSRFPKEILYNNLDELKSINKKIKETIKKYKINLPSVKEAYEFAIELENSAYELHFQKMMNESIDSELIEIFQELNRDDKNHAERIKKLLDSKS